MPRDFSVLDCEQRSAAWLQARAGILTASDAADAIAKPLRSGGEPAARRDLRVRLCVERLTGQPTEGGYVNEAMQRGIDLEAEARAAYEAVTGELATEVGFVRHNTLAIGCSPDGVVGDFEGGVEIKCPKSATHWTYLKHKRLPAEYVAQVTHTLLLTGAPWWDFVSYDPRFPEEARVFVVRVRREDVDLKGHEAAVREFLAEVDAEFAAMTTLIKGAQWAA